MGLAVADGAAVVLLVEVPSASVRPAGRVGIVLAGHIEAVPFNMGNPIEHIRLTTWCQLSFQLMFLNQCGEVVLALNDACLRVQFHYKRTLPNIAIELAIDEF